MSAAAAVGGPSFAMAHVRRRDLVEADFHHFLAEASTLGWPPGFWPQRVDVDSPIGNDQPFVLVSLDSRGATYTQVMGCLVLRVAND